MINIAIFASGTGSNAGKILEFFKESKNIQVNLIATNKAEAKVLDYGKKYNVNTLVFNKSTFENETLFLEHLVQYKIDFIVLAGFLWKIPAYLVKKYPKKIINIHPALLPNYGGKGMYGIHVHNAVFNNKEKFSGITIHLVDELYDNGEHLYQEKVNIEHCTSANEIGNQVLSIEHKNFAPVINNYILSQNI